ncbi:AbrB family transcriptional regulator [Devosia neptuniae]|jgi:membrane AbrB-like protein|uniref:AbrB family transcriptional regulator n=1 Tax=Devosia TaxID=46913 RepID=UPI0022AE67D3|nr:AbrB family transcriptional regulator [Devosia neptuniae]MCZ4344534.1 AbrB family transcriptional regulator [Devosia neptuniae]|tara:strand:- start:62 stop:1132 length:1071 start_codon:yes stop_codon:yes gene_type:complete
MAAPATTLKAIWPVLLTLLISVAGGGVATLVGMPAGWLMGGALAVAVAAVAGLPMVMPDRLRDLSFLLIGMSMGASVAPDSLSLMASWPLSIAALAIELVLIVSLTGWMLAKVFKLDRGTAYLSSFPGHLSFVLGIASTGVGNTRQIVIIQVIRILMLTICVPIGAVFLPIAHFAPRVATDYLDVWQLLGLAAGCVVVGLVFIKLKFPAGFVLGAMAAATLGKLAGFYSAAMPVPLVTLTFVLTGALIGSRFAGISRGELLTAAKGGFVATMMTVGIVSVVAFLVSLVVDMPYGQIWLGLSPGALEGMGALGIALGYDTAFIAAHHVLRLLMLTLAIPTVVVLIKRRESATIMGQD